MKTFVLTLLICFSFQFSQAMEHTYLRIIIDENTDVSYPPGSGFVLQDAKGKIVLTYAELEELGEYNITEQLTLYVFVTYKKEPDVYKLTEGTLYAIKQSDTKFLKKSYENGEAKNYIYDRQHFTKGLEIMQSRFFGFDGETYNASIEFNNGVIFLYRDGKAVAWSEGKLLNIEGKYLISTDDGIIKLSYNPINKQIYYVFEPKEE